MPIMMIIMIIILKMKTVLIQKHHEINVNYIYTNDGHKEVKNVKK